MDVNEIRQLMESFRENGLSELEISEDAFSLKLKREAANVVTQVLKEPSQAVTSEPPYSGGELVPGEPEGEDEDSDLTLIESPIIGTFYGSPSPDSDSYVSVGDTIKKGQVLCIIEAMKIMNEIESEVEGTIVKIFPKNAEAVEYGQKLFAVKPL